MTTTVFANITAALVVLMGTAPAISPNVFRARDRQLAEEHATGINVQFDGATPNAGAMRGAPVDWESRFTVECYAKTSTTSGDLAVDPIVLAVYERIAADSTLGGLVIDIGSPSIEAEYSAEGQKTGWMRLTYPVLHRTSNLTLE